MLDKTGIFITIASIVAIVMGLFFRDMVTIIIGALLLVIGSFKKKEG
ncbi:hypothetical protein [Brevibacillus daliensis]|nr:hypothetical protein [Brevibacillus daliensis]